MKLNITRKQYFLIISHVLLQGTFAYAGDVRFVPRVTVSETYTDNVTLSQTNPEDEYITQINPGFNLVMDGSRFDATVDYNMQNLYYAKDSNRNQIFHQFAGTSTTQLVRQALFFDLNASRFQQVSDPQQPTNNNNIAVTTNQSDVTSVVASPYWQQNLGQLMTANVRYTHAVVNFDDQILDDSKSDSVDARFASPVNQSGITWGLNYNQSKIDFDQGQDAEFERYSLELGYRFSPRTRIYAQYGDEDNNYVSLNNSTTDGTFWSAGIDWQPGAQDRFSLSYGERFFGNTTNFSWNHTAARFTLNTSYLEELATNNQTITQATTTPQTTNINNTNQVFLRKFGQAGVSYNISKTTLALNYSRDLREAQDTGAATRQDTGTASVLLQSSAILQYRLAHSYIAINTINTGFKSYENRTNFSVISTLSQNTSLAGTIGHNKRNTNAAITEYDENTVTVSLTTNFR